MKKICLAGMVLTIFLSMHLSLRAEGFNGEWHRTNTEKIDPGTIQIKNQKPDSFDFIFDGYHGGNMGELEGTAKITDKTKAVFTMHPEDKPQTTVNVTFVLENGLLKVSTDNNFALGFGLNVTIEGDYTKGKPIYTNADIVDRTFKDPALKNKVKQLLGDKAFEQLTIIMEQGAQTGGGDPKDPSVIFQGFIPGAGEMVNLIVKNDKIYCLSNNMDEKLDGYVFYTNDERYQSSMPDFINMDGINQKPRFVYKKL